MKKMLTYIFRMMTAAAVSMTAASCQEFHIDSQPEAPLSLNVDAQDTYDLLAVSPAKVVFNISSNTPWTHVFTGHEEQGDLQRGSRNNSRNQSR